jgi:hypothetical protein
VKPTIIREIRNIASEKQENIKKNIMPIRPTNKD